MSSVAPATLADRLLERSRRIVRAAAIVTELAPASAPPPNGVRIDPTGLGTTSPEALPRSPPADDTSEELYELEGRLRNLPLFDRVTVRLSERVPIVDLERKDNIRVVARSISPSAFACSRCARSRLGARLSRDG
jgi:hypothetical protein